MKRIRKAVVGAATGGLATGIAYLAKAALDGSVQTDDVTQALAAAIAAGLATLATVYSARNAGTNIGAAGSDTSGGSRLY